MRVSVADGADTILLVTEDLFLYEQGPLFETNGPALKHLLKAIAAVPGVKHVMLTHGTIAPVVRDPEVIEDPSESAVSKANNHHPASTHPEKRFAHLFIGLETGSARPFKQFMKSKAYPFRPEQ